MATWTDGAAYAPLERPYGFATPEAPPLEVAAPEAASTPGPVPPPQGFTASEAQIPLDQVVVAARRPRDPAFPFTTASAAIASAAPPVSGVRDPRAPFPVYGTGPAGATAAPPLLPPPAGSPLATQFDASFPPPGTAQGQWPPVPPPGPGLQQGPGQAWPPPGSPPPPYWAPPAGAAPNQQPDKSVRSLLLIGMAGLLFGVLVPTTAPWLLIVAGLMFTRTRHRTGALGTATSLAGMSLLMLTLMVDDASAIAVLAALACLGFGGWALYSLLRSPRPRR